MTEADSEPICSTEGPIDLLVISDLHIRATGDAITADDLPVNGHDAVLSLGDVIDDNIDHAPSVEAGEPYERRGRAFFESFEPYGVPVLAVPGNHDPLDCTHRLAEGLDHVTILHESHEYVSSGVTVAGWGCEQFDFTPALLTPDYPDLGPAGSDKHSPGEIADTVLDLAASYVDGSISSNDLADHLDISDRDEDFQRTLSILSRRFETIVGTVERAQPPTIIATHISPFRTPFDCRGQHSRDGNFHYGSVALRLAVASTAPAGVLSGHTHQEGTDVFETIGGYTYAHNPGASGVSSVTIGKDGTIKYAPE